MKTVFLAIAASLAFVVNAAAEIKVDEEAFGKSLGGWRKRDKQTAEYPLSGSVYRTYKPEISPTPEGGIFISVRIDHVRGLLSSDDHAMLEITVSPLGVVTGAKSNIAIQGRSIASDVILGTNEAGRQLTGGDRAVQIGTDLVADLSAKLLRENIVEAGRVSFPAALRHNYNLLYQALRLDGEPVQPLLPVLPPGAAKPATTAPATPAPGAAPAPAADGKPADAPADEPAPPVAKPVSGNAPLEIQPFDQPAAEIPAQ